MDATPIGYIAIAAAVLSVIVPAPDPAPPTTEWKGAVIYGERDPAGQYAGYTISIESKYEIGLRSDGIMVWRLKRGAK